MSVSHRSQHRLSVLVVDDSQDTIESMADLLRLYGHDVRTALNGEEALWCVNQEMPDVVLLDILMPRLDGCRVAELIRAECSGIWKQPIIVAITGCGSDTDRLRSSDAGFDLHLVKPVNPATLVGVLERIRRLLTPPIPASFVDHPV